VRERLRSADFGGLFVEELGWDPLPRALPLEVTVGSAGAGAGEQATYELSPVAEKRGFVAYRCPPDPDGKIPSRSARDAIDRRVAKDAYEHLVVYTDAGNGEQIWQWARREPGRPAARREHRLTLGAGGEALARRIAGLAVSLKEEEDLTIVEVSGRVRAAFDVEPVTRRFYDGFKEQHAAFLDFIEGIVDQGDREWYASIMLNRLMFVYFIEKKGFLDNGDTRYLRNRMEALRAGGTEGRFLTFYRHFLTRLFHEGLSREQELRDPELDDLLGDVPYLNGGLFEPHELEREYPELNIPDEAFERLFDFFDGYTWHLDERPLREGNEINPDVLGYIFEKYVNQKQMGAYYTKEDVTGYITQNTLVPHLFDTAEEECAIAFAPDGAMWSLLTENPDRYIHDAVKKGVVEDGETVPLPEGIRAGVDDVSERKGWNRQADEKYALPTETWREHVGRRERCEDLREKLSSGQVTAIDDLVTLNLDVRQFTQDAIENCEGPELLRAFYKGIQNVSVLDPTCGSGAFLFAALNVLEPLYEACLERMERFRDEDRSGKGYADFREILSDADGHPNRRYFVLKSIVVRNLYGVDIMEEAVEIARLRLFLKLMSQLESPKEIEPLPDIDFNLRAGNTLVGFASMDEVERTLERRLDFGGSAEKIEEGARRADAAFQRFREMQTRDARTPSSGDVAEAKDELRERLGNLNGELDRYLAAEYGVDPKDPGAFGTWQKSHEPFHWLVEFYGIMQDGGFDVIVGNPPYVQYSKVRERYTVLRSYETLECKNLYALVYERSLRLMSPEGLCGLIVPLSLVSTKDLEVLRRFVRARKSWLSCYDIRPAALFEGVSQRLCIALNRGSSAPPSLMLGGYRRWAAQERANLLELLRYSAAPDNLYALEPPSVVRPLPKFATPLENRILEKIAGPSLELVGDDSSEPMYVHRIVRYFIKALDFVPLFLKPDGRRGKSEDYKEFHFDDSERPRIIALLNSTLFYWFWRAHGDGFHCGYKDVYAMPYRKFTAPSLAERLDGLRRRLMVALNESSVEKTIATKAGKITYQEFYSKSVKPLVDEIDEVLAEHYGFTDKELDFIINYDIKYRVGSEDPG
jgi:hypothetical protein